MRTNSRTRRNPGRTTVYMLVKDYKKLAKLAVIQEVSHRDLAEAAGYKAHSYISRILRGEVKTLKTEPATRIAHFFGVPVEDLFVTKLTSNSGVVGQVSGSPVLHRKRAA